MHFKVFFFFVLLICNSSLLFGQTGSIKGYVYNSINNEPIALANIEIENTTNGAISDKNGIYKIDNLKPGTYNLICSFIGFKTEVINDIRVNSVSVTKIEFALIEEETDFTGRSSN